jgi:hypothetical protein
VEDELEVSEEELSSVKAILKTFITTIKTFGTYPKNNPIYKKFSEQLLEGFDRFFESHSSLGLRVEQYSLIYEGHEAYYSEERQSNIALLLFIDGIRDISFHHGLSEEEIETFIDILRVAPKEENPEDDIVTLLWEKDMEHISYFVPERVGEVEIEIENSLVSTLKEDAVFEAPEGAAPEGGPDAPSAAREASEAGESARSGKGASAVVSGIRRLPAYMDVVDEGMKPLLDEALAFKNKGLLPATLRLIFRHMPQEKDLEQFEEYSKNVGRAIDFLGERNNVKGIYVVLKKLNSLLPSSDTPEFRDSINRTIARAGNAELLSRLFNDDVDERHLLAYISQLSGEAVPELLILVRETPHRRLRRLLSGALVPFAKRHIEPFAAALKEKDTFFVRTILFILGNTRSPEVVPHLKGLIHHGDKTVRQGMARALDMIQSEDAKYLLLKFLNDTSPTIVSDALRALRKYQDAAISLQISHYILSEKFSKAPFALKKEFFITLGESGRQDSMPVLKQIFRKKTLFKRNENNLMRACAAYGLGYVGNPEAVALLEKEVESKHQQLREAARSALERISANGRN